MAADFCIVLTTASSDATVRRIVDRALADKLAACVQVLPIESHYVWKGAIQRDAEKLLLLKAKSADYGALEAAIRAVHDYETPEIVKLDMADASKAYLDWISSVTR
jgi:periplasmic divalent cation tolerance protein